MLNSLQQIAVLGNRRQLRESNGSELEKYIIYKAQPLGQSSTYASVSAIGYS